MVDEPRRLRVVVADDEPMARSTLRTLLGRDPELELVAECKNGEEALRCVREHAPDLLLLDVQMPGMNGFEVVERLGDAVPAVIFVTAYDRYALQAFEVHAIDYLLKPFDDERFERAIERAKDEVRREEAVGMGRRLADLLSSVTARSAGAPGAKPLERLAIHREGRVDLVDVDDVVWIEAADQYVLIHTTEGSSLMRQSMARLEEQLDDGRFVRVHRSAIVALDRIRTLEKHGAGGRVLLATGAWVPVSRSRLSVVRERLG